ncbi:MAG: hypothetical protein QXM31_00830 [Candidatus Woesearchaeota archaeon]
MTEGRGVALAILGIVALIAVVGLVLLFSGKLTGDVVQPLSYGYGANKVYGGWANAQESSPRGAVVSTNVQTGGGSSYPYEGTWVKGVPYTPEGIPVAVVGGSQATYRQPTRYTTCPPSLDRMSRLQMATLSDEEFAQCIPGNFDDGSFCCPNTKLNPRA